MLKFMNYLRRLLCLFALLTPFRVGDASTAAAEPRVGKAPPASIKTIDLFKAGDASYRTYRIPALAITRHGTLLVACAARRNSPSDWGDIDTMFRRSTDGGKMWSEPEVLTDDGGNVVDNPTFIVDPNSDTVLLMYQINYERAFVKATSDEGATWSAPREITEFFASFRDREHYDWRVLAMGPGHGIVLHNGRYVAPVWLATDHSHRPSISTTIYSDDRGATWKAGQVIVPTSDRTPHPSEHVLVQLADGRVMANIRCESGEYRRLISYSDDGATNWTEPQFDRQLYDPICMASLVRLSGGPGDSGPDRLLFANPDSSIFTAKKTKGKGRERRNLTLRLSNDGGRSWPTARVIEPARSGYCDLAVDADQNIFVLYERSAASDQSGPFVPQYLTLAKLNIAWLTDPSQPAAASSDAR